jgi:hypothetical protein
MAALAHGAERHAFVAFVALGSDEPECQTSCIMCGRPRNSRGANAKRTLAARFPPPTTFHDDANQDTNRLSKSRIPPDLYARKKPINGGLRFQLPHDASQWRAIVVQF